MEPAVSQGLPARKLFVDRDELIVEFLRRLHGDPADDVLFLHGEGGIGKSLLLNHLEDRYCCRLDTPPGQTFHPWMRLSQLQPRQITAAFPRDLAKKFPSVLLDFAQSSLGRNPQDRFDGLQMIRAGLGVPAPLFQSACVLYLSGQKMLTREWIERLFPGAGADLASSLLDQANIGGALAEALHLLAQGASATTQIAAAGIGKGLWGVGAQYGAPAVAKWFARRELRGAPLQDILDMKPGELIDALPALLAHDVNACDELASGGRVILLFDAYDRFLGSHQDLSLRDRQSRDAWFRDFLAHLELKRGIVAVVTAQEAPAWPGTIRLHLKPVDYLGAADALAYLEKAGVEPEPLRQAFVAYASVEPGIVQPFFLALLADAYLLERDRGATLDPASLPQHPTVQEKQQDIVDRLLGAAGADLAAAIRALSVCRAFDRDLFFALGDALRFGPTDVMFQQATRLSCVRKTDDDRFRVHGLMRRFVGQGPEAGSANHACRVYFDALGAAGAPDAVYHLHFLNPEAAAEKWMERFLPAARGSLHQQCAALLAVRSELAGRNPFMVRFGGEVGEYLARLSRYSDADVEFQACVAALEQDAVASPESAPAHNHWGNALQKWADLRGRQSDHAGAEAKYKDAVAAYDQALLLVPTYIEVHNNRGIALQMWADLRTEQSDHAEAEAKYQQAVAAYDQALGLAPAYVEAHNNRGNALQSWANLRSRQSDHAGAEARYRDALATYDRALQLAPAFIEAHNNRGNALQSWADLRSRQSDYAGAEAKYRDAVAAYDRALQLAPAFIEAHRNLGNALQSWAEMQSRQRDHAEAEAKYQEAVAAYDHALGLAPDDIAAHNSRGNALQSWADLRGGQRDHAGAEAKYQDAVAAYDRALQLAPADSEVHNNRGNALRTWAELRSRQSDHAGAEAKYQEAVAAHDRALQLAPAYVAAYNNRGNALQSWADLRRQQSDHSGAEEMCKQAVAAYDRALALAPAYIGAHNNRGIALSRWAELRWQQSDYAEAEAKYEDAVAAYDRALQLAPADIEVHTNRGNALQRWAELRSRQSDHVGAEVKYQEAVAAYDRTLRLAPAHIAAHNNRGYALQNWADLLSAQSDYAGAKEKYQEAVSAYDCALALAPDFLEAHNNTGSALHSWGLLFIEIDDRKSRELLESAGKSFETGLRVAANPGGFRGLCLTLALAAALEPPQGCAKLARVTTLLDDWRARFPWDPRIEEISAIRDRASAELGC